MKTTKIITTLATLNLVLFMSITSIADPYTRHTGDIVKSAVKSQISKSKGNSTESVSSVTSEIEFAYLRFDVTNFTSGDKTTELPVNSLDYLRFDVNNFMNTNLTEEMDLPVKNEFDYLRFDVNNFIQNNAVDSNSLIENEFDYLRFDVSKYSTEHSANTDENSVS